MQDNADVVSGLDVAPADEVSRVRRCPSVIEVIAWSCPLTGSYLECHRHLEVPTRKDCFDCGYQWGYETCQVEIDGDGDEGE